MYNNEILDSINNINEAIFDAEYTVLESMFLSYKKAYIILENYQDINVNSFNIFQESFIMKSTKNTDNINGKKKNIIKRLLKICKALLNRIKAFFKKIFHIKDKSIDNTKTEENDAVCIEYDIDKLNKFVDNIINDRLSDDNDDEPDKGTFKYSMSYLNKVIPDKIDMLDKEIGKLDEEADSLDNRDELQAEKLSKIAEKVSYCKNCLSKYSNIIISISNKEKHSSETSSSDPEVALIQSALNYDLCKRSGKYMFKWVKGCASEEIHDKLSDMCIRLRTTKDYTEYKKLFNQLTHIFKFPDNCIMRGLSCFNIEQDGYILARCVTGGNTSNDSITINNNTRLYHTSSAEHLSMLKPTFKAGSFDASYIDSHTSEDSLYPSKRVYFFIDNPGSRTSTSNDGVYKINKDLAFLNVYQYDGQYPVKVFIDHEAASKSYRKACYIETDTEIPVKNVTGDFEV